MSAMVIRYNNLLKALDAALALADHDEVLFVLYPGSIDFATNGSPDRVMQFLFDRQAFYKRLKFAVSVPGEPAISEEDEAFFDFVFLPNEEAEA